MTTLTLLDSVNDKASHESNDPVGFLIRLVGSLLDLEHMIHRVLEAGQEHALAGELDLAAIGRSDAVSGAEGEQLVQRDVGPPVS